MTTIVGYHASAAQKSYGLEKRFLCPPPLIRISGPLVPHLRSQALKMSVLSEMGATLQEQAAQFDAEHGLVCFKQLHINSQGKDKSFQLVLSLADHTLPEGEPTVDLAQVPPKEPWAVFYSNPIHIISKPSKKTTRGNTPGIINMGSIALFNRINSQTVRTKYLSHKGTEGFTTSSSHWSPFTIQLVEHGGPSNLSGPVVYGSRVILKAPGFQSHEYIIRKVEKHRSISNDYGRQVSQMQKIALLRADLAPVDGKVCYLSALVERPGNDPITVVPGSTHATSWRFSEVKQDVSEDGTAVEYHEVNDYATWMITSICTFIWSTLGFFNPANILIIAQFQCTFFDASGTNTCPPQAHITPAPSIVSYCRWLAPMQRGGSHSIEMSVSGFYSVNRMTGIKEAMQVWVGDIGPLIVTSYEGMAPPNQSGEGYVLPTFHYNAGAGNGIPSVRDQAPTAFVAATLPSIGDLLKALLDSVRTSQLSGPRGRSQSQIRDNLDDEAELERDEELWTRDPSLPILFLRRTDGMGFHSGYELKCVAAVGDGLDNVDGWSVRIEKSANLAGEFSL